MSDVEALVRQLIQRNLTISTMESCTAGMLASMITDTEGASAVFPGGYVTYANRTKIAAGVPETVLETYGVYSRECAEAMARTAQKAFGTILAIGITGTTGNLDPNNTDSVSGVVYYSIAEHAQMHSYVFNCEVTKMDRHEIKHIYAREVFDRLAEIIAGMDS